jgi:hypothetical protein
MGVVIFIFGGAWRGPRPNPDHQRTQTLLSPRRLLAFFSSVRVQRAVHFTNSMLPGRAKSCRTTPPEDRRNATECSSPCRARFGPSCSHAPRAPLDQNRHPRIRQDFLQPRFLTAETGELFIGLEQGAGLVVISHGFGKDKHRGDTLKTCLGFSKARKQEGGDVYEAKPESLLDSGIIHFGFSNGAAQPVISVRGDELFAGSELIRKWSSCETAYWVSEKLGAMILD